MICDEEETGSWTTIAIMLSAVSTAGGALYGYVYANDMEQEREIDRLESAFKQPPSSSGLVGVDGTFPFGSGAEALAYYESQRPSKRSRR